MWGGEEEDLGWVSGMGHQGGEIRKERTGAWIWAEGGRILSFVFFSFFRTPRVDCRNPRL